MKIGRGRLEIGQSTAAVDWKIFKQNNQEAHKCVLEYQNSKNFRASRDFTPIFPYFSWKSAANLYNTFIQGVFFKLELILNNFRSIEPIGLKFGTFIEEGLPFCSHCLRAFDFILLDL